MKIRSINRLATIALSALSALTLGSVISALYFQREQVRALDQQRESLILANRLAQGSDFLTNAVRGFAATGEAAYEESYHREVNIERSRDQAVQGLIALGTPASELGLIEEAKRNSDDLINLENRAFDAGRAGNLQLARDLAYGPSYHAAKQRILTPIGQFQQAMSRRLAEEVAQSGTHARVATTSAILMVALSILTTILVQIVFYRRSVVSPLLRLQQEVDGLATRKGNAVLSTQQLDSEIGSLASSIAAYYNVAAKVEGQQHLKQLLSEVVVAIQQAGSLPDLVQSFMHHISVILDVGYGLFYIVDTDGRTLTTVGGFGVAADDPGRKVPFGHGLAGQCAVDCKPILITRPPAGYVHIASGTGEAAPACVAIRPLLRNRKIVGVVELASFRQFDDRDLALLAELEPTVAALMEILASQKEHELALDRRMAFQQALIDNIPNPVFYKGPDTRFLGCNTAYEQTFNVLKQDIVGKSELDLEFRPLHERQAMQREDEQVIAEASVVRRELQLPDADGKARRCLYWIQGFRMPDGSPGGLVGTLIDIGSPESGDAAA